MKRKIAIKYDVEPNDFERMRELLRDTEDGFAAPKISKKDRELLDGIDFEMLLRVRKDHLRIKKFDEKFDEGEIEQEMVKLAPKRKEKLSRQERIERRKQRNEEISKLLEARESADGQVDADEAVKLIGESGIQTLDLSDVDKKRLSRLRQKAQGNKGEIIESGSFN